MSLILDTDGKWMDYVIKRKDGLWITKIASVFHKFGLLCVEIKKITVIKKKKSCLVSLISITCPFLQEK